MSLIKDKDKILYLAESYLGDLGYEAAVEYDYSEDVSEKVERGKQIIRNIKAITKLECFDNTDYKIESILGCLIDLADINDIPLAVPTIENMGKPNVVTGSALVGPQGPPGDAGSDANIDIDNQVSYLKVEEIDVGGVKTFVFTDNTYVAPTINVTISGVKTFEEGTSNNISFSVQSTIGRDDIISRTITSPAGFTLANINFDDTENFIDNAVTSNTTYSAQIDDGTNVVSDSESILFYYPFLWGLSDGVSINTYQDLTKVITAKQDKTFNYQTGGDSKYLWFAYPASYGILDTILDKNGFNVTSGWTLTVANVTSTGLDSNWTISYNIYRITGATDVSGNITFKF